MSQNSAIKLRNDKKKYTTNNSIHTHLKAIEYFSKLTPQTPDVIIFCHKKNKCPIPNNTQGTHRRHLEFISN